ncbi:MULTISPECIES: hydrogenase expression protein HypA/HybF [Aminiphilus]|jgi:DNA-directed RNA polymerase subunit RPC12/RpoP|uniref:hydrogenase expression protein HypA/HybF n=1 Tax=Aminiphilus TaxID=290731 RepID=UPI000492773D|nr:MULTISPECIES: hydrogenase expression protein HypA/HybF [Aminiphilus]
MRTFRCISCGHQFDVEDKKPTGLKCPKCLSRFVELVSGTPLKGKQWGSKSYSVK